MLIGFPLSSGINSKYFQIVDLVFGLSMSETSDNSKDTVAIFLSGNYISRNCQLPYNMLSDIIILPLLLTR